MANMKMVLDGLECEEYSKCGKCPYVKFGKCKTLLIRDVRKLLKEKEAVEPFHKCIGGNYSLIEDSHFDYCPCCGKPITWAKQEGR